MKADFITQATRAEVQKYEYGYGFIGEKGYNMRQEKILEHQVPFHSTIFLPVRSWCINNKVNDDSVPLIT